VDILDTKQVAGLTGLSIGTLRYWRHINEGPASFLLGKRVFYRRSEVERWISEQERMTSRGGVA
jgi:predicted DNA-binding transcriptional regulator AlpA